MRTTRYFSLLIGLLACGLIAAGCGGGSDSTATSSDTTTTGSSSTIPGLDAFAQTCETQSEQSGASAEQATSACAAGLAALQSCVDASSSPVATAVKGCTADASAAAVQALQSEG